MAWTSLTFAYGSVLTSAKMTQVYDNMVAISPLATTGNFGTFIQRTRITVSNATWTPHASTKKIIVRCRGGGGGGGSGDGASTFGSGGHAGAVRWGYISSVSGTYNAVIGTGGAAATAGVATSFDTVSADGGAPGKAITGSNTLHGSSGDSVGGSDSGGAAAANSGSGGGGGAVAGGAGGSGVIDVFEFA